VDGAWIEPIGPLFTNVANLAVSELFALLDAPDTGSAIKVAILESAISLRMDSRMDSVASRLETDDSVDVRLAALAALRAFGGDEADRGVAAAFADTDASVRMAAIEAMPEMPISNATKVAELAAVIDSESASIGERQSAILALGEIEGLDATFELASLLVGIASSAVPAELQFELLDAARSSDDETVLGRLDRLGVGRALENLYEVLPSALEQGGTAGRGRQLVINHPAAQCIRCHTLGDSESTVGPSLNGIGERLSRAELLESLLDPGATLAPEFGSDAASAMPPMGLLLTHRETRDIVEFLATDR